MTSNKTNRAWRLKKRPDGDIGIDDLELVEKEIPNISENEFVNEVCYTTFLSQLLMFMFVCPPLRHVHGFCMPCMC